MLLKWWESYTEDYDMICTRVKARGHLIWRYYGLTIQGLSVRKINDTIQNDYKGGG